MDFVQAMLIILQGASKEFSCPHFDNYGNTPWRLANSEVRFVRGCSSVTTVGMKPLVLLTGISSLVTFLTLTLTLSRVYNATGKQVYSCISLHSFIPEVSRAKRLGKYVFGWR